MRDVYIYKYTIIVNEGFFNQLMTYNWPQSGQELMGWRGVASTAEFMHGKSQILLEQNGL